MRNFLAVIVALTMLAGCNLFGPGSFTDTEELAAIASAAMDYKSQQEVAALGQIEVEDLEEDGAKTLFVEETTKTLPNGTVVTITKVHDDNDTPESTEDDLLTVSRQFVMWLGEEKTEIIERPLRPEADWTLWDNDTLVQEGTCEEYISSVKVASGTIKATWERKEGKVRLVKVEKEYIRLDRNGIIERTIIEIDENGLESKSKIRIKVTEGNEIIIHSFVFEEIEENGILYTKIIGDDGRYAIIRNKKDPRITEHYNADDLLLRISTETRDTENNVLNIEVKIFAPDGSIIDTKNITVGYKFIGNTVIITKTFDNNREVIISIEESDNGYSVNKNGLIYSVVFIENGINIYDANSNLLAEIIFNDDGTWTVIKQNETEIIESL